LWTFFPVVSLRSQRPLREKKSSRTCVTLILQRKEPSTASRNSIFTTKREGYEPLNNGKLPIFLRALRALRGEKVLSEMSECGIQWPHPVFFCDPCVLLRLIQPPDLG
jgi:hypothetical protein